MRWRVAHRTVGYGHLYQGRFKTCSSQPGLYQVDRASSALRVSRIVWLLSRAAARADFLVKLDLGPALRSSEGETPSTSRISVSESPRYCSVSASQRAWTWARTRSSFARSRRGKLTAPETINS